MGTKLKPCPFCGWGGVLDEREEPECYEPDFYYVGFQVECQNPNCGGLMIIFDKGDSYKESKKRTKAEAIKAWNRRK